MRIKEPSYAQKRAMMVRPNCPICGKPAPVLPLIYKEKVGRHYEYTFLHLLCFLTKKWDRIYDLSNFCNIEYIEQMGDLV